TATSSDEDKARQALAVIDGAKLADGLVEHARTVDARVIDARAVDTRDSIGEPWHGRLEHARRLDAGDGYSVRRPARSFGAAHVIAHLRRSIAEVRALYPGVPDLAIYDISAEHGGRISDHHSHQSGLDVDVGFYTTGDARLDLEATWALVVAFARTAAVADGVEIIFLDYGVQRRLYDYAHAPGTPAADLDALLQYPHGDGAMTGLVRHWPNHADHLHVRFKPGR